MKNNSNNQKPKFVINPFEQIGEFVKDTAKETVNSVVDILNPFSNPDARHNSKKEKLNSANHTPLDLENLNKSYQDQSNPQLDAIRAQLGLKPDTTSGNGNLEKQYHDRVKQAEIEYLEKEKREKEQNLQEELAHEQEKLRIENENAAQAPANPKGKKRKNILGDGGHRKSSAELPAEFKPGGGKQ